MLNAMKLMWSCQTINLSFIKVLSFIYTPHGKPTGKNKSLNQPPRQFPQIKLKRLRRNKHAIMPIADKGQFKSSTCQLYLQISERLLKILISLARTRWYRMIQKRSHCKLEWRIVLTTILNLDPISYMQNRFASKRTIKKKCKTYQVGNFKFVTWNASTMLQGEY